MRYKYVIFCAINNGRFHCKLGVGTQLSSLSPIVFETNSDKKEEVTSGILKKLSEEISISPSQDKPFKYIRDFSLMITHLNGETEFDVEPGRAKDVKWLLIEKIKEVNKSNSETAMETTTEA